MLDSVSIWNLLNQLHLNMKIMTFILLCLVTICLVSCHDPIAPSHVEQGWQFFPNGAVVPVDTYEVQVARQQHWEAVRAHGRPHFGQTFF